MTTRNRHACVERLLDSLEKQTRRNFRLVAGLQCPDAAMLALVRRYAAKFPVQSVTLPECGLSAARNRLVPAVSGQIVALTDDDCCYPSYTMDVLEDFFRSYPDVDACIGVACPMDSEKPTDPGKMKAVTRFSIFQNAPSWLLFFRYSAMRRIGAFDERLGVGAASPWQSGEETDYALRLLAQGGKIMRVGSVGVAHPCPDFSCANTAKWYAYGMGRMELLRNHQFPFWFHFLNIVYPLVKLFNEPIPHWKCLLAMFRGRLGGVLQRKDGRYTRTF